MKARTGLGLSAAALACLCIAPGAFATGLPQPNINTTYSAQSVALAATGNTVAIGSGTLSYSTINGTTLAAGSTVAWIAPASTPVNAWQPVGAPNCNSGTLTGTLSGFGTGTLLCTLAGAGTTTFVSVNNPAGGAAVTLSGPTVGLLGSNIEVNQLTLGATPTNPTPVVQINAVGTGSAPDTAQIPNRTLTSNNSFRFISFPVPLGIDLTAAGLPAIPPGAGFTTRLATGANSVSRAGYLGAFWINATSDLDARNGAFGVLDPTDPNGTLSGTATVTLTGDFATLTDAYLIPNNNPQPGGSQPSGNQSACTATRPGNAAGGTTTVNATKNVITFTGLTSPTNTAGVNNEPVFSVCLVTSGTQVIQATVGSVVPAILINASIAVAGITNPIGLTVPNQGFGSIDYLGTVFFAQNVFGINNGSPTFFRMVNQSNVAAPVWAVLTKDVPNTSPEVGAGNCTYAPAGSSSATLAAPPVPPNAVNPPTTCNISFVAQLASQPGLPDTVSTNLASGGSQGFVQANNATYVTGDDIAILAGTSLNPLPGQGALHATVYLLSPNAGMRFSALTQSAAFGVLVQTP